MTQKERMLAGELYHAGKDQSLVAEYERCRRLCREYNSLPYGAPETEAKLRELFGRVGKDPVVTSPVYCDYGTNVKVGDRFYCNYDCIFLDVVPIEFGDDVFIGPRCSFYSATHPIDSVVRNKRLEAGKPIRVGSNVWFGGSVTVCPGVTIGDDVVIGAGSVVVKDLPSHTVCVGNPCRPVRSIAEQDRRAAAEGLAEWEAIFGPLDKVIY